jgi:hypothetical protein
MSREDLKVGSTVWYHDVNHRVYTKPKVGRLWGEIIPRASWRPLKITGETSRSWITASGTKLPKKGEWHPHWVQTESEVDDWEWQRVHCHPIADAVRGLRDADKLRQIAALIGYVPKQQEGGGR